MAIRIGSEDCVNVGKAIRLEWLETNGIGGYASSSILGCHTRRYHGLLVARLEEPAGKYVMLSKLDDSLVHDDRKHYLSVHQYPDVIFPRGHTYLSEFRKDLVPTFEYVVGGTRLTKEIAMLSGESTTVIKYTAHKNRVSARLRFRPLLAFRDFHALTKENIFLRPRAFPSPGGFLITPYEGMPTLHFRVSGPADFFPSPVWYRNFYLLREKIRGFDHLEDLFSPGVFEIDFPEGSEVLLAASTSEIGADLAARWDAELDLRRTAQKKLRGTPLQKMLSVAGRQFVTSRANGQKTITAGYHWFYEWGRDALIAAPGLLLDNGSESEMGQVLETFASYEKDGLVPNFIAPKAEDSAHNSADASLWFAWAVQLALTKLKKPGALPEIVWQTLARIFEAYRGGTRFGIRMLENGLITAGDETTQITWMDATADGLPVTPRHGCAVEINALWYNLLCFLGTRGAQLGQQTAAEATALAPRVAAAINEAFWLQGERYLADVVREGERDTSLRPNQIFAVSLPHSALDLERARDVVAAVKAELYTPYGLRTLSPADPRYRPRYEGGPAERDRAYHNGTVWPWLLGHYGEAVLKVAENKARALEELDRVFLKFEEHVNESGLGTISEIFDGDPPRTPCGCISQAWSVAELLRLSRLIEDEKKKLAKSAKGR